MVDQWASLNTEYKDRNLKRSAKRNQNRIQIRIWIRSRAASKQAVRNKVSDTCNETWANSRKGEFSWPAPSQKRSTVSGYFSEKSKGDMFGPQTPQHLAPRVPFAAHYPLLYKLPNLHKLPPKLINY